jgi:hypothetical protein
MFGIKNALVFGEPIFFALIRTLLGIYNLEHATATLVKMMRQVYDVESVKHV